MPGRTVNSLGGESSRRKRALFEQADSEHSEVLESVAAQSSLRHEPRKRPRMSNGEPHERRSSHHTSNGEGPSGHNSTEMDVDQGSDDEDDEGNSAEQDDSTAPLSTQYETLRDGGFEHLQHEREDDLRATQRINSRPQLLGDNHAALNGILESVTCINFMCHERLHCELGPLLNFIVGENGSGKSAILTALTLCLGGKASSTNRGGSLKAFIKEGSDQAILSVKIKNQGIDAYQHDIYGDSIIVERHFNRSGSSGFKVKSATGKLISNKRGEVSEIAEYFCLQVDNPLNVLSQDNARSFLNSSSDLQKYQFFIQGVQLEQLDNDYRLIMEYVEAVQSKLPEQEERVKATKKKLNEAERLLESIEQNKELRRKRRLYTQQLAWSQVKEQEDILKQREEEVEACTDRITNAEAAAQRLTQALASADAKHERAVAARDALLDGEATEIERRIEAATKDFHQAKSDLENIRREERDAHAQLRNANTELEKNAATVAEEKARVAGSTGEQVARKREQRAEEDQRLARIHREMKENGDRGPELERRRDEAKSEQRRMHQAVESKTREVRAMETRLKDLERNDRSPLDAYERGVPELLRQIANDNGYREKPIGPLGSLISVTKPQWTSLLEKTFGRVLNGFIVTSKADQQRLQRSMENFRIRSCPVLIANRTVIDTRGKEPDSEFDTILRVLKFEDDMVRNQLIINSFIEQIILVEKRLDAENVLFKGPPPRNVKACICFHDIKRGQGLRLTNRGGGSNLATAPVVPGSQKPRMKADMHAQVSQIREALSQLQTELADLVRRRDELKHQAQVCEQELVQQKRRHQDLTKAERQCQGKIFTLDHELDDFEGYDDRLKALEAARVRLEEEYETFGQQYGELKMLVTEHSRKADDFRRKLAEEKLQQQDFDARRTKAEAQVNMAHDARRLVLRQKNDAFEEVEKAKEDKRIAQRKTQEQQDVVATFISEAVKFIPERVFVPDGETYKSIEAKVATIKKQLDAREKRIGRTDDQIKDDAANAKIAHMNASDTFEGSRDIVKQLKRTIDIRLDKWRNFQRYISSSARANFLYLLSERGYRGQLILDHVDKKLQVQVEPDATRKNATGRNTKTLSGGEKSFSSICLLLAIWDSMGSPLRCLDEFDVFMDNVNRAISTNMLVSAARRSVSRQYIMITPNAIEGRAKVDKDVNIIRYVPCPVGLLTWRVYVTSTDMGCCFAVQDEGSSSADDGRVPVTCFHCQGFY
ncbi:hypothetical protein RB597_001474 [Gaeumannomyces tritici]